MNIEQALKWADTWGPVISCPPDGDAQALVSLAAEVRRLRTVETASHNLIAQKGRHNTEIAYKHLEEALKTTNAELCGGPSGPSERAPSYASAPKTEE